MVLSLQECINIIILCGCKGWSHRNVADEFDGLQPERNPVSHGAVVKLFNKFTETGSVSNNPCSGHPSTNEEVCETIMAKFSASPTSNISRTVDW
jgi:transposase